MENLKDRLKKLVEIHADGKDSVFANNIGVSQSTFHNYVKKGRSPNAELFYPICNKYNVNLNWLVTGMGSMYIEAGTEDGLRTNAGLLADCIEAVEKVLKATKKSWTSDKKARFIALQYEYYLDSGKKVDYGEVVTRLRLVS